MFASYLISTLLGVATIVGVVALPSDCVEDSCVAAFAVPSRALEASGYCSAYLNTVITPVATTRTSTKYRTIFPYYEIITGRPTTVTETE